VLYREIKAVCSELHTKHINTLCGQNVELLNVKPGGTYSDHWCLDGQHSHLTNDVEIITIQNVGLLYWMSFTHQKFTREVDQSTCADVIRGYTYVIYTVNVSLEMHPHGELFPFCAELFSVLGSRNLVSWSGHNRRWELLTVTMRHGFAFFSKV